MRKKRNAIFMSLMAVVLLVMLAVSCVPEAAPQPPPGVTQPGEAAQPPAPVTLVKANWSGGDLDYTKTDGTLILGLDGTNGDAEITSATITGGTATALTITTLTAPTVSGTTTINDLVSSNATLTAPTVSGTTAINDLTSSNITVTGGAISGATISVASPTITGTSVVANRASGASDNLTAGSGAGVVVTHGMSGTPTRIFLSWAADEGGDLSLYPSSINATYFTINPSANVTNGVKVYWLALIADE